MIRMRLARGRGVKYAASPCFRTSVCVSILVRPPEAQLALWGEKRRRVYDHAVLICEVTVRYLILPNLNESRLSERISHEPSGMRHWCYSEHGTPFLSVLKTQYGHVPKLIVVSIT